ncbi:MAG: phosphatidylserine decarboxylase family protein [Rhizobiales bacterium PAR1]|nr:MAG: phosphatidylserine decarboxylase family protein [Rhizobiales bacterium PAR1]
MSVVASVRKFIVPIHPEGYLFIVAAVLLALFVHWLIPAIGWLFWFLPAFVAYFFRDPPRVSPMKEGLVLSPADGRISQIGFFAPPAELGLGDTPRLRISIFLNVFDVHINRTPAGGKIRKIVYTPGLFLNADLDKASQDNERNALVVDTAHGPIVCVQIAGLIARRILCFVREGEELAPGARFGLIRFGSRTDIYLPEGAQALVAEGQRAIGGETVLCDLTSKEPQRSYRVA